LLDTLFDVLLAEEAVHKFLPYRKGPPRSFYSAEEAMEKFYLAKEAV
jgi:hypothetical protein